MLKIIYRVIILIAVFIASIIYFSRDIKEVVFNVDNTTVMEDATYPLVTIKEGDNIINLLHGYSSNIDANLIRESVTPLDADQSFDVVINQEDYNIKKLNYELRDYVGNELIETGSVSVFDENGNEKSAKLKLKTPLVKEKEYAVKITLVTSSSNKIYFYQRVKLFDNSHLKEKLSFVMDFHNALKNKTTAENIIKYLEPSKNADNSSFAKVNINSSFDLVSWGNLNPEFVTDVVPEVIEIYSDTASVELNYIVKASVSGNPELYEVKEFYRVKYTKDRMYLLDYDRTMEAFFDMNLASVSKSQLKLGISSDTKVQQLLSADNKKLAFVRSRELWFYNLEDNTAVRVFSFRQDNSDYIRDIYDQHDIKLLNMDAEGNVDFLVYGYMNRGQYEGKVAVILYKYVRAENRIEERAYIPVEEPYQTLKENLGELAYVNSKDVFYFNINGSIYSYSLITRKLTETAGSVYNKNVIVINKTNSVAWQGNSDPAKSEDIKIMNLETGEVKAINTRTGYNILLLDTIDSNLVYGFAVNSDITKLLDGRTIIPMNMVEIADTDMNILKNYSKTGYYITNLAVKDNIIELDRVKRDVVNGRKVFTTAPNDYIMNQITGEASSVLVTTRVTDAALTELYLTLPSGFTMNGTPKITKTVNTVISEDPTLRLPVKKNNKLIYYAYAKGEIMGAYYDVAAAVRTASDEAGVVLNSDNQLVWERGVKAASNIITKYDGITFAAAPGKTIESCMRLMLSNLGRNYSLDQVTLGDKSITEVLGGLMDNTPVSLTGITLDDALYYVSKGRPVLAMTDSQDAVLIYGYDTFNIDVVDPKSGRTMKIGLQDSTKLFEGAGNVFISYLE